jgi:2OG-Fe(II) oxygenase superfamily
MAHAKPFEHVVLEDLFNPLLLELVLEEFEQTSGRALDALVTEHESTYRARFPWRLGSAATLYFGIVNSAWFVDFLEGISEIPALIPDVRLFGGGMHETRQGGAFDIHRDFNLHDETGLDNELVLITYLNKHWDPAWGGALELWNERHCVRAVAPDFGRTILMRHSERSFHGHPVELKSPPARPRRSVACYYYSNRWAERRLAKQHGSFFLGARERTRVRKALKEITPPILWKILRGMLVRR